MLQKGKKATVGPKLISKGGITFYYSWESQLTD